MYLIFIILIFQFIHHKSETPLKHLSNKNENVNWNVFEVSEEEINKEKYLFSELDFMGNIKNNDNQINTKVIVGIDFGTSATGYSYSLGNDISKIKSTTKKPSEIIVSIGNQIGTNILQSAHITMKNYNQKELSKILYIKTIRSIIDSKNETINDNLCYYYPNHIILNIREDVTSFFTLLKKDILNQLNSLNTLQENQILWIIAVPFKWDEFQKQLIYKSLIDSGMINNKMIYESDAASLSLFYDKFIDKSYRRKNNNFLLIDLGSSSVTFSFNKIEDNNGSIRELLTEVKNDIGYNYIVEDIINVFISLIGEEKIKEIKSKTPWSWIKFLEEINTAIENTQSLNGAEMFEITNIFNIARNKDYECGNIKFHIKIDKYIINLPSTLIGNIIFNNINKINYYLDDFMKILKNNRWNINSFIITGGFSQNKIIKNEINKYAQDKKISAQYMSSYHYSISKGCVLYGINPEKILQKKSPINLGIYNFLKNEMEILIKKGDEIDNEIKIIKNIRPQLEKQDKIQIFIYITEKDINNNEELKEHLFGRLLIKTDNKYENIQLTIKYDTHLAFSAINYESGGIIKTEFQFLNDNQIKFFSNILR